MKMNAIQKATEMDRRQQECEDFLDKKRTQLQMN